MRPIIVAALAVISLFVFVGGAIRIEQVNRDAHRRTVKETADNCYRIHLLAIALIPDEQDQIASTLAFLHDNPNGIPGIGVKLIKAGLQRDLKTLARLRAADCH